MGIITAVMTVMALILAVEAQQFNLVHKYAHLEGSPANSDGQGASQEYSAMLKAHDRRRLAAINSPLGGDSNTIGLYYTQITLGTPPSQYHVQVDTGSDLLWLNCDPCPGCPLQTNIPGIALRHYDPSLSSTDTVLGCSDTNCAVAAQNPNPTCTSSQACEYMVQYGDGSSTTGYFVNDVLTFAQIGNATNGTASVYFGCGTNQTGNLLSSSGALDGLMGFGQAAVAVPTQLADQGATGKVFAHCLQGDNPGGGTIVIGTIAEPGIAYTPIVPRQSHYNVGLQNIAVSGMNVTTPDSFALGPTGGVIMDSGSTRSYLVQPAFDQFVAAIVSGAPVPSQPVQDGSTTITCWDYSGDIATTFPPVRLVFDGGAVMDLAPTNYLYLQSLTGGGSAYCMGWLVSVDSTSVPYTIFGDIVLKDQLVVYDNENQQIGWKPFNCTQAVSVTV